MVAVVADYLWHQALEDGTLVPIDGGATYQPAHCAPSCMPTGPDQAGAAVAVIISTTDYRDEVEQEVLESIIEESLRGRLEVPRRGVPPRACLEVLTG